jgi:hypothetical protein
LTKEGLHAPGIVGLNIYVTCILEYIDGGGASCLGSRGVKCFPKFIVEYIDVGGASCPGIGGLKFS